MVRINDGYIITREPISLMIAIVGIIFALYFMFSKLGVLQSSFTVSDDAYSWFFASYTLIACIVLTHKASRRRVN